MCGGGSQREDEDVRDAATTGLVDDSAFVEVEPSLADDRYSATGP